MQDDTKLPVPTCLVFLWYAKRPGNREIISSYVRQPFVMAASVRGCSYRSWVHCRPDTYSPRIKTFCTGSAADQVLRMEQDTNVLVVTG